jgi:hypothetical protein
MLALGSLDTYASQSAIPCKAENGLKTRVIEGKVKGAFVNNLLNTRLSGTGLQQTSINTQVTV